jgi:hypothetical protein
MIVAEVPDRPFSLEVFSDDFDEMGRQSAQADSPRLECLCQDSITIREGRSAAPLVRKLTQENIKLNVTALMTAEAGAHRGRRAGGKPQRLHLGFRGARGRCRVWTRCPSCGNPSPSCDPSRNWN